MHYIFYILSKNNAIKSPKCHQNAIHLSWPSTGHKKEMYMDRTSWHLYYILHYYCPKRHSHLLSLFLLLFFRDGSGKNYYKVVCHFAIKYIYLNCYCMFSCWRSEWFVDALESNSTAKIAPYTLTTQQHCDNQS